MIPLIRTSLLVIPALAFAAGASVQNKPIGTPKALVSEVGRPPSETEAGRAVPLEAQEFPLSAVKLLDGPFRRAMETDKAYLLRLDPDRLLAGFRREAGLPRRAEPYGGWETIPETGRYSLAG